MKTTLILVLCLAALVMCHRATAETDVYLGAWSVHVGGGEDYNGTHNLIGVRHDRFFLAHFINSHYEPTTVALYEIHKYQKNDFILRLGAGMSYGYGRCTRFHSKDGSPEYCPAATYEIQYTRYKVKPSLIFSGNAVILSFAVSL